MGEYIVNGLIISLICIGINALTWKGMLLEKVALKVEGIIFILLSWNKNAKTASEWICKPLFSCLACMSSVWTLMAWCASNGSFNLMIEMLVVCGLNVVGAAIINDILPD